MDGVNSILQGAREDEAGSITRRVGICSKGSVEVEVDGNNSRVVEAGLDEASSVATATHIGSTGSMDAAVDGTSSVSLAVSVETDG